MIRLAAIDKLQHLLQTLAFCLAISTIEQVFNPRALYGPSLTYSLFIGTSIWAIIDLGRHLIPSARETGWPTGTPALLLPVLGIVAGFAIGNTLGDLVCRTLHLFPPGGARDPLNDLRNSVMITLITMSMMNATLAATKAPPWPDSVNTPDRLRMSTVTADAVPTIRPTPPAIGVIRFQNMPSRNVANNGALKKPNSVCR